MQQIDKYKNNLIIRYLVKQYFVPIIFLVIFAASSFAGDRHWTQIGPTGPMAISSYIFKIAIDPTNPKIIYAAPIGRCGIYKSIDAGTTWRLITNGINQYPLIDFYALAIDPTNPQTIYAGFGQDGDPEIAGIYKSINSGESWSLLTSGRGTIWNVFTLAIDPNNPQTIYAGAEGGYIYKTTNGGSTWNILSILTTSFGTVNKLAIDPSNSSIIYAGISWGGAGGYIRKSTDGGLTWSIMTTGLGNQDIMDLVIDPSNSSILYVGTMAKGVFKSLDAGASWI